MINTSKPTFKIRLMNMLFIGLLTLLSACGDIEEGTDTSPPVITLNGNGTITLFQGDTYTELGASALDEQDGIVSVTTSGSVDTSTIATYTITYSASDSAGNSSTATRAVTVLAVDDTTQICPDGQTLDVPANLILNSEFSNADTHEVRTNGIWAIWWDPQFDHTADVEFMMTNLNEIRCDALNQLGMQDPPNLDRGSFFNVYIHHGEQDSFPNGWANGVGTDSFSNPFMTLPVGAHLQRHNLGHEGFHVFQYNGNSPGFSYSGDSQWYIETTANWYSSLKEPDKRDAFLEAGAIEGNPQLTLWHSFSNQEPDDPVDWMYQVRQYGMHTFLYFLTEELGLDSNVITRGFYTQTDQLPQEYLYNQYGAEEFRQAFVEWAASNVADFDYLLPAQVERARQEVDNVGDPNNINKYVAEYNDEGTGGALVYPPENLLPRSWAYNVIRVKNTLAASYRFSLVGDDFGNQGASSSFAAKVVLMSPNGPTYVDVNMSNQLEGEVEVAAASNVTDVYLVVASVPNNFRGNQTFTYQYSIERTPQ